MQDPRPQAGPTPVAFARFRSLCPLCGDLIEPGDPIVAVGEEGWAHELCALDELVGVGTDEREVTD